MNSEALALVILRGKLISIMNDLAHALEDAEFPQSPGMKLDSVFYDTGSQAILRLRDQLEIVQSRLDEFRNLGNSNRRNPTCDICWEDPCGCDPSYRAWLDEVDRLLIATVKMAKKELPSDYMWADAYEQGLDPAAAINVMVGPLNDPKLLLENIYIEGAGFGEGQRRLKLSNDEIGRIAENLLDDYQDFEGNRENPGKSRKVGKSLPEMGYDLRKVAIYRAAVSPTNSFKPMDYVTRSRAWAVGHAEHIAVVEEEDANVLKAMVNASDVYEAYNPGEYFYNGPEIAGTVIKIIPAFS